MRTGLVFAALAAFCACPDACRAQLVVNIAEVGGDVVATASGSLNISALSFSASLPVSSVWSPSVGLALLGANGDSGDRYIGTLSGPSGFGPGGNVSSSSGTGSKVGIQFGNNRVFVPNGYISGAALTSSSTFSGTNLATLGITPGSFTWTWGSGVTAGSFQIVATSSVAAIPEPSGLLLASVTGAVALAFSACRNRRGRTAASA